MAKNDVILLDGIIDQRMAEGLPSHERDEVFEFFVLDEVLKDYDLPRDEIETGWIDGRNDGGIDGFYILINGHLFEDASDFVLPRSHASIDVWLFTCKHHSTFVQATLDAILATIQELFDFSLKSGDLKGSYSDELLQFRTLFHDVYRRLSIQRPILTFQFVYASRGDTNEVGESVVARGRQIESTVTALFSSCAAHLHFIGASELIELHRKSKKFALDLPFLEHLATGKESYVLLVRLEDYWRFVSDESGHLRRYLFDSNVRDYLGTNQVNEDIARSLEDPTAPDFWWLNNGVTILATNATVPGKTIQLQDIQIVNGLQTTETIYRYFQDGSVESRNRALLVKIIVSSDAQARDRIIRATNNQSPVEIAALHATDKIQRDIEEILERNSWYYERRRNYYRNIGKPQIRFVTPLYLASAVVALVFKNPVRATRLKSKFMRTQNAYDAVFSKNLPIVVWPVLVEIYKQVDVFLTNIASRDRRSERFISSWRALVSFILVARRLQTFAYTITQLQDIDVTSISALEVEEIWELCAQIIKGRDLMIKLTRAILDEAAIRYALPGLEEVGRRDIPSSTKVSTPVVQSVEPITAEFVNSVRELLPNQPWKPGIHLKIASQLKCDGRKVSLAIRQLISDGTYKAQIDGVVYNTDGSIVTIDLERVPHRDSPLEVSSPEEIN